MCVCVCARARARLCVGLYACVLAYVILGCGPSIVSLNLNYNHALTPFFARQFKTVIIGKVILLLRLEFEKSIKY